MRLCSIMASEMSIEQEQKAGTSRSRNDDFEQHIGRASSLLPPVEDKRRSNRRQLGSGTFKRAGWAALDEADQQQCAKRKPSIGRAAASTASSYPAAYDDAGDDDERLVDRKRKRELFPTSQLVKRVGLASVKEEAEEDEDDDVEDEEVEVEAIVLEEDGAHGAGANGRHRR